MLQTHCAIPLRRARSARTSFSIAIIGTLRSGMQAGRKSNECGCGRGNCSAVSEMAGERVAIVSPASTGAGRLKRDVETTPSGRDKRASKPGYTAAQAGGLRSQLLHFPPQSMLTGQDQAGRRNADPQNAEDVGHRGLIVQISLPCPAGRGNGQWAWRATLTCDTFSVRSRTGFQQFQQNCFPWFGAIELRQGVNCRRFVTSIPGN